MTVRYATIEADPPWLERGGGGRGAQNHYEVMSTEAIVETMLRADAWRPATDAHLYLWVTNTFLEDGLFVMRALGFRYVTNVAWVKGQIGLGQYFRGAHELALFGVRGSGPAVRTEARDIPSVIYAKRGRHSQKPNAFYRMVERRSVGPRLRMFARASRDGWDSWGDQAPQDAPQAPEALTEGPGAIGCYDPAENGAGSAPTKGATPGEE